MIILVWFTIKVLVINEIGSIGALYNMVMALATTQPVEGNLRGSYLTMTSKESLFFGIIHITYVHRLQPWVSVLMSLAGETLALFSLTPDSGKR